MSGTPITGGMQYDITPQKIISGDTGFRHYTNFNLSQGDIANLIYSNNMSKFVNLVDNRIYINGILNTLSSSGSFYNGSAIFVSPMGMVVGASGVLNVGSLTAIAPTTSNYLSYLYNSMGQSEADSAASVLSISSPDYDGDITLESLKTLTSEADIDIQGKIFARGDVELYAKNISVAGDSANQAAIFAGIPNDYDIKMETLAQANTIFNELVSTNLENGTGFSRDSSGNIVISAKSVKTSDTSSVDDIDDNSASVTVNNSVIAGQNVDISAVSEVTYEEDVDGSSLGYAGDLIESLSDISDITSYDYLGARAKAAVDIGENTKIAAAEDIKIESSAAASTTISSEQAENLIYAGAQTVSNVTVGSGAELKALNNINVSAKSHNVLSIDTEADIDVSALPEYGFSFIQTVIDADTQANIESGAVLTSGSDVDVSAYNITGDSTSAETKVVLKSEVSGSTATDSGIAFNLLVKDTNINTQAVVDGTVTAGNDVSVNAQNLHVENSQSKTTVKSIRPGSIGNRISESIRTKLINSVSSKISGISDTLSSIAEASSGIPSTSVSLLDNTTALSATAQVGKNANITAGNDVTVNANTVDLTQNSSTASNKVSESSIAPGVAVILNSQTINTNAVIEDGDKDTHALINAGGNLTVNSTLEQPWGDSLIDFAIAGYTLISQSSWDYDGFSSLISALQDDDSSETTSQALSDTDYSFSDLDTDALGVSSFLNNWAQSTSKSEEGTGIAASVIVTDSVNNTLARIGDGAITTASTVSINAANKIYQFNCAGALKNVFDKNADSSGIGGNILIESVDSSAKAQIGDDAVITADSSDADNDINIKAANEQNFLTVVVTGSFASSKDDSSVSISGSTIIQNAGGETESSVGASELTADSLNIKAGEAEIKYADDVSTSAESITLSNSSTTISDGISNLVVSGAVSSAKSNDSAVAAGAAVNVSEFTRDISAVIADGATINLADSLNVIANSDTASLNVALAGAFTGGVKMDTSSSSEQGKVKQLISKLSNLKTKLFDKLSTVDGLLDVTDTGKLDSNGNAIVTSGGVEYSTNSQGVYQAADGTTLKDSSGNDVKAQASLGSDNTSSSLTNSSSSLSNASSAKSNLSAAAAGAVNIQINDSSVKAEIGAADITVGSAVNVEASQKTSNLNVAAGVAKASTVGAGAAVNFIDNANQTIANVEGANIIYTSTDTTKLNVKAEENNDNIQVAVGVGAATNDPNNTSSTTAAAGGSFNNDILENTVSAQIKDTTVKNQDSSAASTEITVDAENHSTSYKGAGGLSVSTAQSSTSIGAGIASNLNVINKTTYASIENSELDNVSSVGVYANKDASQNTETLISAGIGGSIVTGASSAYTFDGALGTDIINNSIIAQIINNTSISSASTVDVIANNNLSNMNITGAIGISGASNGVGIGVGSVVNVLNNDITAQIENSSITAKTGDVSVEASNIEDLDFYAANLGIQTGSGTAVDTNGIVNVSRSNILASVIDSEITTDNGNLNLLSSYEADVYGVTAVVSGSNSGLAFGANVLSNTFINNNTAKITDSTLNITGNISVNADSDETIDVIPAAVAVTVSGSAAAAANIGVNVLSNSTNAYIDGGTISSDDISVSASDDTTSKSRGGTVAVSGSTAAVAGSILADVYVKDVNSYIDNVTITKGGDISVNASAENIFGSKDTGSITASSLVSSIGNNSEYDVSNDANLSDWDMTFDASGSSTAAVSGSIIAKTVVNDVNAYLGSGIVIQEAGDISVAASNETSVAAIIGNVSASGTAAVGASLFMNVNTSSVNAGINEGAQIGTVSSVGDIDINALSTQDIYTIDFVVGASGTAAVSGALTSHVIVNDTNAYTGKDVTINSGDISVNADDTLNIEALNLAVSGSGTASVGVISNVNVFNNTVSSVIGQNTDSSTDKSGSINAGSIDVNAHSAQDYQANVLMVAGSGAAAVGGVVISNTMATNVIAGIEEITVNADDISVTAENAYNEKHKDQTTGVQSLTGKSSISTSDLTASNLIPLVSVLNITGSGTASVGGSIVNNNVITAVDSYVKNADITTTNGLNLNANSLMTTYDAVMGVAISGIASVATTGVVNVYSGSTVSEIENSKISGSAALDSSDEFNLNTIIFTVAGSVTGAAVNAVTNTNTIVNDVIASITGSEISNASTVDVNSSNNITIADIIAAGSVTGAGAAVNFIPINNIFIGNTKSYIDGTSIDGAETTVSAENNIDTISVVLGVAGSGIGADVSGYALTNVFDNDLDAYITNSTITNSLGTSVNAQSDLDMNGYIVSGGVTGAGASVIINAITNVVNNNMNSYIANSSISGGDINVDSYQHSDIYSTTLAANATGVGNSSAVNSIINILTNNAQSYIDDTEVNNAQKIAVATETENDIENINYGVSASGISVVSANSLVNVIENTGYSYIDAQSQTMSATGDISVTSEDNLSMNNKMGMLSASGVVAAGANVNVNVLNNAVKSEILSNTDGSISTTGGVNVSSSSVMALKETVATASAGLSAGIAGTVIVNSIGGKYTQSDSSLNDAGIGNAIDSVNDNYDDTAGTLTYEKDGETVSLSKSLSLTGSSGAKEGTVANISANVEAQNSVNVTAKNTVKGYNSDTLTLTNSTAAAGAAAAGVGVIVNDTDYNTKASISGGSVVSNSNVNVKANSTVKADIDTVSATVGVVGVDGGAGYFNNSAVTSAIIDSAKVEGNTINVAAESVDDIDVNVSSKSAGYASLNVSVAISETSNEVNALIKGSDVDIDANTLNVTASNTSSLSSELDSNQAGGIAFTAVVNRAESNAITKALINATGDITTANSLNIIAQSGGISASSVMNLGNISAINVNTTEQGAFVNSEFYSGLDNSNLTVTNSGQTKILSGVNSSKNTSAAEMSATVTADQASVTLASGSYALLNAVVGAVSEAKSVAKKHTAGSMYIASMLDKSAIINSASNNIGAVVLGAMQMNSDISGSNTITVSGDNEIKGAINILLSDDSSTSTSMINGSISLGSAYDNSMKSVIETATTVDISGTLAMNSLTVNSNVNKTAFTTVESKAAGLVGVDSLSITTSAQGTSTVNFSADAANTDYKNAVKINSNSTNSVQSIQSDNSVALLALQKGKTTTNLTAANTVNFDGAAITSTGDFDVSVNNENKYSIKKTSSSGGVVVFSGNELVNNIKSEAEISVNNSDISAKNVDMSAKASLGNVNDEEISYTIGISGGLVNDNTSIENKVEQNSNIEFINSSVMAEEDMDISIETESSFAQKIQSNGSGFTSKNVATSTLTVTNNNTLSVDKNSSLRGDTVDISLDSSNTLSSEVDIDVSHFGGRDPEGYSYINLNVNNNINNNGTISAGSLAQFDFMTNSTNVLTQNTSVIVEAAIATAEAGGGITYNLNNKMNVSKGASIVSDKDIIANYSNGTNSLNSTIYSKKTSRLLFGIPITTKKTSSSVTQNYSNSLVLDGEIIAGSSSDRYMYIDKDGNIDYNTLSGFSSNEYELVDAVSVSGEELTAETIASLNSKIESLNEKLESLNASAEIYEEQIEEYNTTLAELNAILEVLGNDYSASAITSSDVSAAIKSNIASVVVGDGDSQISSDLFDDIYSGYEEYIQNLYDTASLTENLDDITTFENYLTTYTYGSGTKLTNAQITTLTNAYSQYESAVTDGSYFSTYELNGTTYAIIDEIAEYDTIKASLQNSIDNLETLITSLNESKESIDTSITTVSSDISDYTAQVDYLTENPLSDLILDHSAIEFENLTAQSSVIELNGIKSINITGSGSFKTLTSELIVDNYSSRNLIFKNIDLSTSSTVGLYIDGVSYSNYLDSNKSVNLWGLGKVYYVSDKSSNNGAYAVSINTYYDYNDTLADAISSEITFGGYVKTAGSFSVLNENGDINFSNIISASDKSILAPQGDITYDAPSSTLTLNSGDEMIAGKNVTVNAKSFVINGLVQAGLGDRTITITDSMLSNLIVDPSTGLKNMIDIGSTDETAYLNSTNNIKVLYVDGKIIVFNLENEGGNVTVNGKVSGSGKVNYTDGYNNVTIVNNTSSELVVNSISNNENDGSFTYKSGSSTSKLTVSNLGHDGGAVTQITSNGAVTIAGAIENGLTDDAEILSTLTISSNNGITINALTNELGTPIDTIATAGDLTVENGQSGSVVINGDIDVTDGEISITNEGEDIEISGAIEDTNGDITIANNGTGSTTLNTAGSITADDGNISITNAGENVEISGAIEDISGDITIANNGNGNIAVTENGSITADEGYISITNAGENIEISGAIEDTLGDITIANNGAGDVTVTETASITASDGDISITNEGENIEISGAVTTDDGNISILNEGNNDGTLTINSSVADKNGDIYIYNNGTNGTVLTSNANITASGNNTSVTIENAAGGIAAADNSVIKNDSQTGGSTNLVIKNTGDDGITLAGSILNVLGDTEITNDNTNGGIAFETTSNTINNDGNIYISNNGNDGIFVEGIVNTDNQDIIITNSDSEIVIGENTSTNDNYINAKNGNVVINQTNGDILNGITDENAYKTLIAASGNLTIDVENGNVGSDTNALEGKESGFSINAETRDYTESLNVNINGVVNITASESDSDGALINLRAKDSDLNIGEITTDGNVMLTAADWKQADESPVPDNEEYYTGYSVTNAADNSDTVNITGNNISIIASNNIGESNNKLTYNQLTDGTISALAENSIYLSGKGNDDNVWQMIAKRGDIDVDFAGNAEIREITSGEDIKIVSTGADLTIYELGTTSNISDSSDILYSHDGISISSDGIVPETVEIKVLNTNESTKSDDGSTLNIYTAYVKGNDEDGADVTLRADNITAHAYDAASSTVSTKANPDGFDAQEDRLYSNDYTDSDSEKVLEAQGFNTYGEGGQLVFDIQGVSPEDVKEAGASVDSRTYNAQKTQTTISEFSNPNAFDETVYKANSVTLSLNSSDESPTDNRGLSITNLYADNAYIDTKDLNLDVLDAYITDYAEFLNGNRNGSSGGHYVSGDYRWLVITDNDYSRNIANLYDIPVTSQLYTALTGSFYLHLGNSITQQTKAPVVYYSPYNSVNNPSTENSFFRITYKDDKIQKSTTELGFKDIDKDTQIKTKREYIRFYVVDNGEHEDGFINVSYDKSGEAGERIISVEDISRGGLFVVHDGSLKLKEKFTINLSYNDVQVSPEVMVVRLDSSNRAGLKFINLDEAAAAKILYMNMSIETANKRNIKISQR